MAIGRLIGENTPGITQVEPVSRCNKIPTVVNDSLPKGKS
jgi:hypothetical protein